LICYLIQTLPKYQNFTSMKNALVLFSILLLFGSCANAEMKNDNLVHHKINVRIDVEQSKVKVDNYIELSGFNHLENFDFFLNRISD